MEVKNKVRNCISYRLLALSARKLWNHTRLLAPEIICCHPSTCNIPILTCIGILRLVVLTTAERGQIDDHVPVEENAAEESVYIKVSQAGGDRRWRRFLAVGELLQRVQPAACHRIRGWWQNLETNIETRT